MHGVTRLLSAGPVISHLDTVLRESGWADRIVYEALGEENPAVYLTPFGVHHLDRVIRVVHAMGERQEYVLLFTHDVLQSGEHVFIRPIPPLREVRSLEEAIMPLGVLTGAYVVHASTLLAPDEEPSYRGLQARGITFDTLPAWRQAFDAYNPLLPQPRTPEEAARLLRQIAVQAVREPRLQDDFAAWYAERMYDPATSFLARSPVLENDTPDAFFPGVTQLTHLIFTTLGLASLPAVRKRRRQKRHA